jgi:hypothetical protein
MQINAQEGESRCHAAAVAVVAADGQWVGRARTTPAKERMSVVNSVKATRSEGQWELFEGWDGQAIGIKYIYLTGRRNRPRPCDTFCCQSTRGFSDSGTIE